MSPKVAVIVVNWNGERFIRGCLRSLQAQDEIDREIVVVDNGSTDGSAAVIADEFPGVRLILNSGNLGFATANNQALRATDSPYVALLNNDAEAEPGWLRSLLAAMESGPRIGSCASLMLFAHNPAIVNSAGIALDRAGIAWDRLGGRPASEASEPEEIFGACAGAALYRREMLDEVGAFDDDFFAYLEDVDLAWRARLRGWRCLYVPTARVRHYHSGTAGEGSPFKNFLLGRNKIWTLIKNYPAPQLLYYLPAIVLLDLGSIQYSLLRRGDFSPLRGRLAGLAGWRKAWRKRREVQSCRSVNYAEVARWTEPVTRPDKIFRRYRHLRPLARNRSK